MEKVLETDKAKRRVVEILPSAYFMTAEVIITECGHRHLRPLGLMAVDDTMNCPFCQDEPVER